MKYHVRQYRPNFFSGFHNDVVRDVEYDDILKAPWFENFRHKGFEKFTISPYDGELIIEAHYANGEHWVAGFAVAVDDPFASNWRYKEGGYEH
jgi:hypothetical protein